MSDDKLKITFEQGIPPLVLDVVAPDFHIVKRLVLKGGDSKTIEVSIDKIFFRVHLSTGGIITLNAPNNLDLFITKKSLMGNSSDWESSRQVSPYEIFSYYSSSNSLNGYSNEAGFSYSESRRQISPYEGSVHYCGNSQIGRSNEVQVILFNSVTMRTPKKLKNRASLNKNTWHLQGSSNQPPFYLESEVGNNLLRVHVPGNSSMVSIGKELHWLHKSIALRIQVQSRNPNVDTILSYLRQGNIGAAEVMAEWASRSVQYLNNKKIDPYSAIVGAYLLLRIRRFDLMLEWAKILADRIDYLADGCVIWAWQLIYQQPKRKNEIHNYLMEALVRGLPVYTEGLRLLIDGLRLLGNEGDDACTEMMKNIGDILWDSPLTAQKNYHFRRDKESKFLPIAYDIQLGGGNNRM